MCCGQEHSATLCFPGLTLKRASLFMETHTSLHNLHGLFTFQLAGTWSMLSVGLLIKMLSD